jgi:hypothetical protein
MRKSIIIFIQQRGFTWSSITIFLTQYAFTDLHLQMCIMEIIRNIIMTYTVQLCINEYTRSSTYYDLRYSNMLQQSTSSRHGWVQILYLIHLVIFFCFFFIYHLSLFFVIPFRMLYKGICGPVFTCPYSIPSGTINFVHTYIH